jgi:CHASE3 domain sensor protein
VVANHLERLVVDLETGLRGYIITGQPEFVRPAQAAQASFPQQAAMLEELLADDPYQLARGQRIVQATNSYIDDYFIPARDAPDENPPRRGRWRSPRKEGGASMRSALNSIS